MLYSVTPCINKRNPQDSRLAVLTKRCKQDSGQPLASRVLGKDDWLVNTLKSYFSL